MSHLRFGDTIADLYTTVSALPDDWSSLNVGSITVNRSRTMYPAHEQDWRVEWHLYRAPLGGLELPTLWLSVRAPLRGSPATTVQVRQPLREHDHELLRHTMRTMIRAADRELLKACNIVEPCGDLGLSGWLFLGEYAELRGIA